MINSNKKEKKYYKRAFVQNRGNVPDELISKLPVPGDLIQLKVTGFDNFPTTWSSISKCRKEIIWGTCFYDHEVENVFQVIDVGLVMNYHNGIILVAEVISLGSHKTDSKYNIPFGQKVFIELASVKKGSKRMEEASLSYVTNWTGQWDAFTKIMVNRFCEKWNVLR